MSTTKTPLLPNKGGVTSDDSDSVSIDSLDSIDAPSSNNKHTTAPGFPTDASGLVPNGTSLLVSRTGSRCKYTGLVFTLPETYQQSYVAEFLNCNASAKRNEIVLHRGGVDGEPSGHDGDVVGAINFHHWLQDQSRSVEISVPGGGDGGAVIDAPEISTGSGSEGGGVANAAPVAGDRGGSEIIAEIKRPHVAAKHSFSLGGREMTWRQSKGEGERKVRRFYQRHLKCQDSEGREVATFFLESYRGKGEERTVGRFEVQQEGGLERDVAEALLLTFVAVYIKLRKRAGQGMQAGNLGGLVTTALYVAQG
ncbi:hypothetical protein MBLNU230_g2674t1 [Neophaeotheca triangularis]